MDPPAFARLVGLMHNHKVKPPLAALLALFALAISGCSPSPNNEPLTPAERERLMNSEEARAALKGQQVGPAGPCGNSTSLTRFQARDSQFRGPNGFGTLPCGPNNDVK